MQTNIHHQVKDAINVLGVTLKVSDHLKYHLCILYIYNATSLLYLCNLCIVATSNRLNHSSDGLDFITCLFVFHPIVLSLTKIMVDYIKGRQNNFNIATRESVENKTCAVM